MLTVMKNKTPEKVYTAKELKKQQPKDTIVTRVSYVEERDKDNNRVIKRVERKVNLTKKINETAKTIKVQTALDKINEAEKEMLNKGVV